MSFLKKYSDEDEFLEALNSEESLRRINEITKKSMKKLNFMKSLKELIEEEKSNFMVIEF